MLALDDTLARKRGLKMFGTGMHDDPLQSSRGMAITNWGHSWVVLGVNVEFPFGKGHYYCLPILFRMSLNQKSATKHRRAYRSRPEFAVEMLQVLCGSHQNLRFHVVADSAYGGKSVLCHLPTNSDLTSRLVKDARLYAAAAARQPGSKGRPRLRGELRPTPQALLTARCRRVTLEIYGRRGQASKEAGGKKRSTRHVLRPPPNKSSPGTPCDGASKSPTTTPSNTSASKTPKAGPAPPPSAPPPSPCCCTA